MIIRDAVPEDAQFILNLIIELAVYEKAPDEVIANIEDIRTSLFGDNPVSFCKIAEVEGEMAGFAIWFLNYSTWLGKPGIYLEDLFVKPEFRGSGIGLGLMKSLADICLTRGYERFQWWVLDWNETAIDFYKSIGAQPMAEWTVFRLSGEALVNFAKKPNK
ncbi:MAG: GNAT family N-acetyltransferase [Actinomycetes bacterium]|jgi:GNAT superfamily N-acetyltransferase